jgi:hypothetical protein
MPPDTSQISVTLRAAYDRYQREYPRSCNAYDWYRRSAQSSGRVSFGSGRQLLSGVSTELRVDKLGNRWMVKLDDLDAAMAEARAAHMELAMIDTEYEAHRLLVGPGKSVRTSWGGYSVAEHFHFSWNSMQIYQHGSAGQWICSACWKVAHMEHGKPECHACSDWGGCGRDCTLSAVTCIDCGTSMAI